MLYLAITFVAAGIVLIIYSLFVEHEAGGTSPAREEDFRRDDHHITRPEKKKDGTDLPEERRVFHGDDPDLKIETVREDGSLLKELDVLADEHAAEREIPLDMDPETVPGQDEKLPEVEAPREEGALADTMAVLYEDASNLVDYDNETNVIDPTFREYQKLKRVGRGKIEIARDGLNFYVDRKFFRFDFHRLKDIKAGGNFAALSLKGNDVVRLFLFEGNTRVPLELKQGFRDYIKELSQNVL
jgi:hypothetical protein